MPWAPTPFFIDGWNNVSLTGVASGQTVPSATVSFASPTVMPSGVPSGQAVPSLTVSFASLSISLSGVPSGQVVPSPTATSSVGFSGVPGGRVAGAVAVVFAPTPPRPRPSTGGGGGGGGGGYWYVPPVRATTSTKTLEKLRDVAEKAETDEERGQRLLREWLEQSNPGPSLALAPSTGHVAEEDRAPGVGTAVASTTPSAGLNVRRAAPAPPATYRILRFDLTGWQIVGLTVGVVLAAALVWYLVVPRPDEKMLNPPKERPARTRVGRMIQQRQKKRNGKKR